MKFQIKNIIIWPKSPAFPPRVVTFQPGKLNVITGASRTGKSAIIPIIDYCLAASDCFIPIDVVRDNAAWYGVVFQTDTETIMISRKAPQNRSVSNEFFVIRGKTVSIPTVIESSNETPDGVKHLLNAISYVPYLKINDSEERNPYQARLGFRDLMALVFQNQDIIANQNILFYKTHAHEHRERLRNWFPYILGAETLEVLKARQRLQVLEKMLNQLRREIERVRSVSAEWMANMVGHIKVAKEYGLKCADVSSSSAPDELLAAADEILANIPEYSRTNYTDIENANNEMRQLESEEEQLSSKIGAIKKRLSDLKRLQEGFEDYKSSIGKRVERLQISKWLENVALNSHKCPACGSKEHPNAVKEFKKISTAFAHYEMTAKSVAEIPTSFAREEARLKEELQELLIQKEARQKRFDLMLTSNKKARDEFQKRKNMFLFLGHLKASKETFEAIADDGEFQTKISILEQERDKLSEIVDFSVIKKKVDMATAHISQGILKHVRSLDVEDKYKEVPPLFDIKNLNISVLSSDAHWHPLAEVGSASNWVSFHLALMCALQEYFIGQKQSCVPSFVIFDQPSQVYFPKLKKGAGPFDKGYESEDVSAVKSMFSTIANSILSTEGAWQGIILEHADDGIYGKVKGVHEVEEWRDGKKLIPEEWYKTT